MTESVDLRELAIDRTPQESPSVRRRLGWISRYVLPAFLFAGFLLLMAWASRDYVFPPREVTVLPVISMTTAGQREGVPLFKAAGWIEPRPTPLRVAAMAPGVIEKLLVVEDQPVIAGDPLAELVSEDARLALERAQADSRLRAAELVKARAILKAAETRFEQPVHLKFILQEAEAAVARLETQLTNLPFELRRAVTDLTAAQKEHDGKVAAGTAVAGIQIEFAKSRLESARTTVQELQSRKASLQKEHKALTARRDACQTQLEILTDEVGEKESAAAQVEAAEARNSQALISVAEAKLRLDRMTIRAPVTGRIYRLVAQPGSRVGGGLAKQTGSDGSTIVTMYQPRMLQVRVDVRFEDVTKVTVDQLVEIDNPALATALTGRVLFISSEADIQKNTLQVKVAIPRPPSILKPEMLVEATFLASKPRNETTHPSKERTLYVPKQLVQQDGVGHWVWLADQSAGTARRAVVQIAPGSGGDLLEVTSGLTVTSRLIVGGREGLANGTRIKVTAEDSTLKATFEQITKAPPENTAEEFNDGSD